MNEYERHLQDEEWEARRPVRDKLEDCAFDAEVRMKHNKKEAALNERT